MFSNKTDTSSPHATYSIDLYPELSESPAEPTGIVSLPSQAYKNHIFTTMIAGGIAGCISKTAMAPLSRLTILYQVDSLMSRTKQINSVDQSLRYLNMTQLTKRIINDEGFLSLWKGNFTSVLHRFPYSAINFSVYEFSRKQLQRILKKDESVLIRFLCGAAGGAVACVLCYPLDIIRTRLTVGPSHIYSSSTSHQLGNTIINAYQHIIHTEGLKGLYRGLGVSLSVAVPNLAIGFAVYGTVKDYLLHKGILPYSIVRNKQGDNLSPIGALVSGSCSGMISSLLVYPADVIRRRMQIRGLTIAAGGHAASTPWREAVSVLKSDGPRGFYRGIAPELVKVTPAVGITFCVYELVLRYLNK